MKSQYAIVTYELNKKFEVNHTSLACIHNHERFKKYLFWARTPVTSQEEKRNLTCNYQITWRPLTFRLGSYMHASTKFLALRLLENLE